MVVNQLHFRSTNKWSRIEKVGYSMLVYVDDDSSLRAFAKEIRSTRVRDEGSSLQRNRQFECRLVRRNCEDRRAHLRSRVQLLSAARRERGWNSTFGGAKPTLRVRQPTRLHLIPECPAVRLITVTPSISICSQPCMRSPIITCRLTTCFWPPRFR
jgi:hypothetical protein